MATTDYGAGLGFGQYEGYVSPVSHNQFIVWLIVFGLAAVAVIGGLRVWGFTFAFKR